MFKGRSKGRMSKERYGGGAVEKVPLNGLFSNGYWQCNCTPRSPAQHLQTKKPNQNYGRWFYKCQKAQHSQCGFFLWDDDAKLREEAAVLNNSRTEPLSAPPLTPSKRYVGGIMTPETTVERSGPRFRNPETTLTPYTPSKSSGAGLQHFAPGSGSPTRGATAQEDDEEDEFFEWPPSDDEDLSKVTSQVSHIAMPPPETPRKAAKTHTVSSPGKRRHDEIDHNDTVGAIPPTSSSTTVLQDDDFFTTSATTSRAPNLFTNANLTPHPDTPIPRRFLDVSPPSGGSTTSTQDSDLTTEILSCLIGHHVTPITPELKDELRAIGTRHSLQMRGVTKGRDISREQIARKNETIAQLQGDIAALRNERETSKTVNRHLRQELQELETEKEKGWK